MKRVLTITCLNLIFLSAFSQKVSVQIVKFEDNPGTGWEILDEQFHLLYSGDQLLPSDSISLGLEGNRRYIFHVSFNSIFQNETRLFSLKINGEAIILITSEIGAGDHYYYFFTGIKTPQTKITGGTSASISDFPWQVYLIAGNFQCGGSIINDTWVVTAAHCVLNDNGTAIPAANISVKVGATSPQLSTQGKTYSVQNATVNPSYNSVTHENDIALLKIAGPINFTNATPIKLVSPYDVAHGAIDPGVISWVTGYGLISVTPQLLPTTLQKVQLPIVSDAQAATVWGPIPATDLMAGFLNGNKDACSGDSGGPLVVPVFTGFKLAGIVSWGSGNCNTYGAYSDVSVLEPWIRSTTGIIQEFTPPSPAGDSIVCQATGSTLYTVPNQTGATLYDWQMSPVNAGTITGNSGTGTVIWNNNYTGPVTVWFRATVNSVVSEWSWLKVRRVVNTVLNNQSRDTVMCAGRPITLNVDVSGDNLKYSWTKDGNPVASILPGLLNYPATTAGNSGGYICTVSGTCGTVSSRTISLTVHPVTKITFSSPGTEVAFGGDATIEVRADGFALSYQWEKDNVLIDNSNNFQLFIHNASAQDIGLYSNKVTGACGIDATDSIYLYVKKSDSKSDPEVFLWPTIANDKFTVALSNNENYTVRLFSTQGRLMKELRNCRYQTIVDIAGLPQGTYIVELFNNTLRKSTKMIIIR